LWRAALIPWPAATTDPNGLEVASLKPVFHGYNPTPHGDDVDGLSARRAGASSPLPAMMAEASDAAETAWPKPVDCQRVTILLVDDDDAVREVSADILREAGYEVLCAEDGAAALGMLQHEAARIRVMIADYSMPGMNGHELLRSVRRSHPDVGVLLVTGYTDIEMDGEPDGLDTTLIIRKPYRPGDMLRQIEAILAGQTG
jgi:CheY-like chemotaxis protein